MSFIRVRSVFMVEATGIAPVSCLSSNIYHVIYTPPVRGFDGSGVWCGTNRGPTRAY